LKIHKHQGDIMKIFKRIKICQDCGEELSECSCRNQIYKTKKQLAKEDREFKRVMKNINKRRIYESN